MAVAVKNNDTFDVDIQHPEVPATQRRSPRRSIKAL